MSTNVASIEVDVPVEIAYDEWSTLPMFPAFMDDVDSVTMLGDGRYRWVTRIAGVQREFESTVGRERIAGRKIAWTGVHGLPQVGAVTFEPAVGDRTLITVTLDLEPSTIVEKIADRLGMIRRRLQASLEEFKQNVEARPTGCDLHGNHDSVD